MTRSDAALRVVGGATLAGFALCAFTPLPNEVCRRSVVTAEPRPAQAIVVLGSTMTPDGMLSASSLRRALLGIELYRAGWRRGSSSSGRGTRPGIPRRRSARTWPGSWGSLLRRSSRATRCGRRGMRRTG
jgi:hypothetical protein